MRCIRAGSGIAMSDREKVIKGLEMHKSGLCNVLTENGKEYCPYWENNDNCMVALLNDTLSLLKAQEPRVMTLEEVRKHYTLPPVVLDDLQWQAEYLSNIAPLYFEYKLNSPSVHWRGQREAQHCLTHWAKVYGRLWRCWTSRPTEEQRKAVKWE